MNTISELIKELIAMKKENLDLEAMVKAQDQLIASNEREIERLKRLLEEEEENT